VRISRLLLFTNDGSERFYRNVEGLLRRHGPRLYAIRLEIDEHELGELLYGPERVTRLVLREHKNAVGAFLLAVVGQWQDEQSAQACQRRAPRRPALRDARRSGPARRPARSPAPPACAG